MSNVIQRGKIFYFRMAVSADCRETIGQSEIKSTLETGNPLDAEKKADKLTAEWKSRFADIRSGKLKKKPAALKSAAAGKLEDFRDQLKSNLEKNLPPLLNQKSNEDLRELSDYYQDQILTFRQGHPMLDAGKTHLELPELGLTTRWKP